MKPGDTDATVHNQFIRPGAQPVLVDYSMRKTDKGWKIYDIVVEGVSLVLTYRSEFDAVAKQDGIDGLIKRLAQKNTPAGGSALEEVALPSYCSLPDSGTMERCRRGKSGPRRWRRAPRRARRAAPPGSAAVAGRSSSSRAAPRA